MSTEDPSTAVAPPRRRSGLRRVLLGLVGVGILVLIPLEIVRGTPIRPTSDPPAKILEDLNRGTPWISSQSEIERVGALAHRLVVDAGYRPGPFHVKFLPRLDRLEKIHHLVHSPLNEIRLLYCDIWIHSLTTYGLREPTWALHEMKVRPALKLPILIFLVDRLRRERSGFGERLGALTEAFSGMDVHAVGGRARIWDMLFEVQADRPGMDFFVKNQLAAYQWEAIDLAEIQFWRHMAVDPSRERVLELIRGEGPPPDPTIHPGRGCVRIDDIVRTYQDAGGGSASQSPSLNSKPRAARTR